MCDGPLTFGNVHLVGWERFWPKKRFFQWPKPIPIVFFGGKESQPSPFFVSRLIRIASRKAREDFLSSLIRRFRGFSAHFNDY